MKLNKKIWNTYGRIVEDNPRLGLGVEDIATTTDKSKSEVIGLALDAWCVENLRELEAYKKHEVIFDLHDDLDVASIMLRRTRSDILTEAIGNAIAEFLMNN